MNLQQLWQEYQSALRSFLLLKVANGADVEDILQEVLIKTHHNLGEVHHQSKIKPWLFQIANNAVIDFYRKRGSKKQRENDVTWYDEDVSDVIDSFTACLEPFIKQLPEQQRQLLMAIELEGISQKNYAEQNGISYSTLKSRVKKAREMLKKQFDDCCHFEFDKNGNVIDYQRKGASCR
ncbi:MAG: RNA polymerase sigma factor SigZ [Psychrobium sp.]